MFLFSKSGCHLAFVELVPLDLNLSLACGFVQEDTQTAVKWAAVLVCCITLRRCTWWTCFHLRPRYPRRTPQTHTASPQMRGERHTHSGRRAGPRKQTNQILMHFITLGRQHVDGLMSVWIICRRRGKTTALAEEEGAEHSSPYIVYSIVLSVEILNPSKKRAWED